VLYSIKKFLPAHPISWRVLRNALYASSCNWFNYLSFQWYTVSFHWRVAWNYTIKPVEDPTTILLQGSWSWMWLDNRNDDVTWRHSVLSQARGLVSHLAQAAVVACWSTRGTYWVSVVWCVLEFGCAVGRAATVLRLSESTIQWVIQIHVKVQFSLNFSFFFSNVNV
jgi:hypothetical protein